MGGGAGVIRRATLADSASLRRIVARAWEEVYPSLPVDEMRLIKTTQRWLGHQQCECFVSVIDDKIRGVLACSVSPLDIHAGLVASDHCFWCDSGEGMALIRAYSGWARSKGAVLIGMDVQSGSARAARLIERAGFRKTGGMYMLEASDE